MRIGSVIENQNIEKRIAITPEIIKKYISIGFEVILSKNYGSHLGINDQEFLSLGVKISDNDTEILSSSEVIVQLGILSDDKCNLIKENQTLIGVLDPYNNKDKLEALSKKKNKYFFFRITPKNNKSTIYGHIIFPSKSCWI